MITSPFPLRSAEDRSTVFFSIDEGWISIFHFNKDVETNSSVMCRSEVMPYSESQMRYLRARAEAYPSSIYIFQAKRDQP